MHECHDGLVGRDPELLLKEQLVQSIVLKRCGPVTQLCERGHESQRHPRVRRISGGELAPPPDGRIVIAACVSSAGQRLDGSGESLR
jgi:hypothetical protein